MSLITCEIILILLWSSTFVIANSSCKGTFAINDIKLYVPIVPIGKLLEQLKSGFKRTIN